MLGEEMVTVETHQDAPSSHILLLRALTDQARYPLPLTRLLWA